MSDHRPYQLIDFGDGRKLERLGEYLLDRPCPAAEGVRRRQQSAWAAADARYERTSGTSGVWLHREGARKMWHIQLGRLRLELQTTASGQVGFFPEQMDNWKWLSQHLNRSDVQAKVLNLFAYTGGSSVSAAAAGAAVVHVDSSKSAVSWAKRNAGLSGLGDAPIRWIVEDAVRFVRREIRRGNQYDAIILDPPSYGHGPKGEAWKIERDLRGLLSGCAELIRAERPLLLLTCHTPSFDGAALQGMLRACFPGGVSNSSVRRPLRLCTKDRRTLASGVVARFPN